MKSKLYKRNIPIMGFGLLCNFLNDAEAKINFVTKSDVLNIKLFNKFVSNTSDDIIWDIFAVKSHNFIAKLSILSKLPAYSYKMVKPITKYYMLSY